MLRLFTACCSLDAIAPGPIHAVSCSSQFLLQVHRCRHLDLHTAPPPPPTLWGHPWPTHPQGHREQEGREGRLRLTLEQGVQVSIGGSWLSCMYFSICFEIHSWIFGNRLISKCSLNLPDVFLLFKCDYVMAKEPILHDFNLNLLRFHGSRYKLP